VIKMPPVSVPGEPTETIPSRRDSGENRNSSRLKDLLKGEVSAATASGRYHDLTAQVAARLITRDAFTELAKRRRSAVAARRRGA
jgi:hypothetical protein